RTQILESCWIYLSSKGIDTALITISPFTIDKAKEYIDTFASEAKGVLTYEQARDAILEKLERAFGGANGQKKSEDFLAFIGYPPVLDAIATLLTEEQNYHK